MDSKAISLLTKERVCVVAVTLRDGSPHVAEVHYSEQLDPIILFIQTYPTVKVRSLQENGGVGKAASSEEGTRGSFPRGLDIKII